MGSRDLGVRVVRGETGQRAHSAHDLEELDPRGEDAEDQRQVRDEGLELLGGHAVGRAFELRQGARVLTATRLDALDQLPQLTMGVGDAFDRGEEREHLAEQHHVDLRGAGRTGIAGRAGGKSTTHCRSPVGGFSQLN